MQAWLWSAQKNQRPRVKSQKREVGVIKKTTENKEADIRSVTVVVITKNETITNAVTIETVVVDIKRGTIEAAVIRKEIIEVVAVITGEVVDTIKTVTTEAVAVAVMAATGAAAVEETTEAEIDNSKLKTENSKLSSHHQRWWNWWPCLSSHWHC